MLDTRVFAIAIPVSVGQYVPMTIKTASEYRALAADCRRRSAESFDRCDTDGYLSQWASDQMAVQYEANAQRVESGGVQITVLVEISTGKIVATEHDMHESRYGFYYLITDDDAASRLGRFFTESTAQNEKTAARNNAKKGIRVETRTVAIENMYESRRTGSLEVSAEIYDSLKGTTS